MSSHQWKCINCGMLSGLYVGNNPQPPGPNQGSKCSNSSDGKHNWTKIK